MHVLILVAPAIVIPLASVVWAGRARRIRYENLRRERMREDPRGRVLGRA